MSNEYTEELEEEIEGLESENTLLSLQIENLQDKLDELQDKHKLDKEKEIKNILCHISKELGIDYSLIVKNSSNVEIINLCRSKIEALRNSGSNDILNHLVDVDLFSSHHSSNSYRHPYEDDFSAKYLNPPSRGEAYAWARDVYKEQASIPARHKYRISVKDLCEDNINMIRALQFLAERYISDLNYRNQYGKEGSQEILISLCKQFKLQLLSSYMR